MTPEDALRRVLQVEGVDIPRFLVATHASKLAVQVASSESSGSALAPNVQRAAESLWPEMRPPVEAAIRRAGATVGPEEDEAFVIALEWASSQAADNPLALAMVARAAAALGSAINRSEERLRAAEVTVASGGREGAVAAATAVGASVIDLLDVDVEDYEPELVAYVDDDQSPEALDRLARETGETELRELARNLVRALHPDDSPATVAAVSELAAGPSPEDPAKDALWVPAMIALAEEAIALAMASGHGDPDG
ncbi:MAG: hypothetical protein OEM67_02110 [Thermoleophilia bacterium]|nr:hypothetical protein [Thermoleophilia bacterium]MDH3725433.1 hypothetical protein [Thermoleophilia bacterium]